MTTPNAPASAPTATPSTPTGDAGAPASPPAQTDPGGSVTGAPTATPSSSGGEGAPAPSAAEIQREKLLLLREKRRSVNVRQQEEALKSKRAEIDTLAKRFDPEAFKKDPVSFLEQHGIDPVSQLDRLVAHATELGTPEASLKKLIEPIAEENKALKEQLAKLAAREEERERAEAEAAEKAKVQAVHQRFLKDLDSPDFAELRSAYNDQELIAYGEHFANQLQAARRPVSFQSIAGEILKAHRDFVRRISPKATESKTASATEAAPPKTRTLSNSLDADVIPTVARAETPAEKIARLTRKARASS